MTRRAGTNKSRSVTSKLIDTVLVSTRLPDALESKMRRCVEEDGTNITEWLYRLVVAEVARREATRRDTLPCPASE